MCFLDQKIINIIANILNISTDAITLNSRFVEDLGLDSLSLVELVMNLELEFKCDIPDNVVDKMRLVRDIVLYLRDIK